MTKDIFGKEVVEEGIHIIDVTGKLNINYKAREWCKLQYPGHSKGCPNYGKLDRCPPNAPLVEDWIDLNRSHWFIAVEFDLKQFVDEMKRRHPDWSDRNARNCLRWQGKVKSQLKARCEKFKQLRKGTIYDMTPEAMGVQVIVTARRMGLPIKAKPENTIYKIALVGYPRGDAK